MLVSGFYHASATDNPPDSSRSYSRWLPDFIPVQFAGNIGFLSTGVGYTTTRQTYQLSVLYGYVPASIGKSNIHSLTVKNFFPLAQYGLKNSQTFIPYLGIGLSVELGGNAFFTMPDHFPESYYDFPKNLHLLAYGGARIQHLFRDRVGIFRGLEFYAEAGTIDAWLWYKTISSEIKFNQIFSIALGINLLVYR